MTAPLTPSLERLSEASGCAGLKQACDADRRSDAHGPTIAGMQGLAHQTRPQFPNPQGDSSLTADTPPSGILPEPLGAFL